MNATDHRSSFYAVSIPAVLLLGLSKVVLSRFWLSGRSHDGARHHGSQAAAIHAAAVRHGCTHAQSFRKELDWKLLAFMLPLGCFGIVVGALLFKILHAQNRCGHGGYFAWAFLAQRKFFPPKAPCTSPCQNLGALMSASGFTSFVSHSGGRPSTPTPFHSNWHQLSSQARWQPTFCHQPEQMVALRFVGPAGCGQLHHFTGTAAFRPLGVWMA